MMIRVPMRTGSHAQIPAVYLFWTKTGDDVEKGRLFFCEHFNTIMHEVNYHIYVFCHLYTKNNAMKVF